MKRKQITAAAMAFLMAAAIQAPAYAYGEGPAGKGTEQDGIAYGGPNGTTEEEAAAAASLEDNKMEYGELGALIENYNADYKNASSKVINNVVDLEGARMLKEEASELKDEASDLDLSDQSESTREIYKSYKETAKELRKAAQKITNTDVKDKYLRSLKKAKSQLTMVAQQMMIGYEQAVASQPLINKQVELAEASLSSVQLQAASGMKSQEDILTAEQNLKTAENAAAQFNAKLQSTKQTLQMLTGWSHDAQPEICEIPAPDLSRIAAMNPANDLQAATGASYALYDIRSVAAAGSSARNVKKRNVSQMEQDLASTLQSLYASVIAGRQTYEGAQAELQAAVQDKQAADRKNSMGMMGRQEYLKAEADYLTAVSDEKTAELNLFLAMEKYDWTLKGLDVSGTGGN